MVPYHPTQLSIEPATQDQIPVTRLMEIADSGCKTTMPATVATHSLASVTVKKGTWESRRGLHRTGIPQVYIWSSAIRNCVSISPQGSKHLTFLLKLALIHSSGGSQHSGYRSDRTIRFGPSIPRKCSFLQRGKHRRDNANAGASHFRPSSARGSLSK
jgi:hypothetical protein